MLGFLTVRLSIWVSPPPSKMTQAGAQMRYSATELAIDDDILTGVLMDSALGFQTHKV